jgi:hypothetical protein
MCDALGYAAPLRLRALWALRVAKEKPRRGTGAELPKVGFNSERAGGSRRSAERPGIAVARPYGTSVPVRAFSTFEPFFARARRSSEAWHRE